MTAPTPSQEALSAALFELHEAAMDAANDPNPDTLRAVRKAGQKVDKLRAPFLAERTAGFVQYAREHGL